MLIRFTLNIIGFFLAHCPLIIPRCISAFIGNLIYYLPTERRRTLLSNLHHAFPEKSKTWRRTIAKKSTKRFIEMALLSVASLHLSESKIKKLFTMGPETRKSFEPKDGRATLFLLPHFAFSEALAFLPIIYPQPDKFPLFAPIYRPLSNPELDKYTKKTRERFGLKLISRKNELGKAIQHIKKKQALCILFDQNAGPAGSLSLLFNRLASSTELPQIIANKYKPQVSMIYPVRTGFWKASICTEILPELDYSDPINNLTFQTTQWLEDKLRSSFRLCASWLWIHGRWKHQEENWQMLKIQTKRNLLADNLKFCKLTEVPRKTRYWFRMPNWLGDVVMTLPLLKAIRACRPDLEITLLVQPHFIELLKKFNIADQYIPLPNKKSIFYYLNIWKLSTRFPDIQFLFTNSLRGDLEARLIGAAQRLGIQRPNKSKRKALTQAWNMPENLDESCWHQTNLWELLFKHFALRDKLDYAPFSLNQTRNPNQIGLICGTENSPEKRWPIIHWVELINKLIQNSPEKEILLLGTKRDKPITQEIINKIKSNKNVTNLAGTTDLIEFTNHLSKASVIICNDTGGMHLANAVGTPIIALFGPTNLVRTGPIFESKTLIIQAPHETPQMNKISTEQVFNAFLSLTPKQ